MLTSTYYSFKNDATLHINDFADDELCEDFDDYDAMILQQLPLEGMHPDQQLTAACCSVTGCTIDHDGAGAPVPLSTRYPHHAWNRWVAPSTRLPYHRMNDFVSSSIVDFSFETTDDDGDDDETSDDVALSVDGATSQATCETQPLLAQQLVGCQSDEKISESPSATESPTTSNQQQQQVMHPYISYLLNSDFLMSFMSGSDCGDVDVDDDDTIEGKGPLEELEGCNNIVQANNLHPVADMVSSYYRHHQEFDGLSVSPLVESSTMHDDATGMADCSTMPTAHTSHDSVAAALSHLRAQRLDAQKSINKLRMQRSLQLSRLNREYVKQQHRVLRTVIPTRRSVLPESALPQATWRSLARLVRH